VLAEQKQKIQRTKVVEEGFLFSFNDLILLRNKYTSKGANTLLSKLVIFASFDNRLRIFAK
jgi:hypothetical protein